MPNGVDLSISSITVPSPDYSTFGSSRPIRPSVPDTICELKLRVFATRCPNILTIRPYTIVFWRSQKIGYVTNVSQRWDDGPLVCEISLRISNQYEHRTELSDLFLNIEPSMLRISDDGSTLTFQRPIDETRRIVRALRDQARREGRLGPAHYVEDEA